MRARIFSGPSEFREWLERNHGKVQELLVGIYNQRSSETSITYREALDEALCFGWIDGIRRRHDETSYTIRFTPRKPGSIWSAINTRRVGELKKLGRMHAAGQKVFDERDRKKSKLYSYERGNCKLEAALEKQFRANKRAWTFYQAQAPWYRRTSCWWVMSAKQETTRSRRFSQLIQDSAAGVRIKPLQATKLPGK
jgi:uncharacterized protein YdeI (YjbR/CyaY-like superfamily)